MLRVACRLIGHSVLVPNSGSHQREALVVEGMLLLKDIECKDNPPKSTLAFYCTWMIQGNLNWDHIYHIHHDEGSQAG